MNKAESKTTVKIEIFSRNGTESEVIAGRFLGMVTDDQFHAMIKDKSLTSRLSTVRTKTLSEISGLEDVVNMRLALVIKSRNNKSVNRRQVFFSEPLDMISAVSSTSTSISANGKNGSYMLINEYIKGVEELTA